MTWRLRMSWAGAKGRMRLRYDASNTRGGNGRRLPSVERRIVGPFWSLPRMATLFENRAINQQSTYAAIASATRSIVMRSA
jgi:hypothetical protein